MCLRTIHKKKRDWRVGYKSFVIEGKQLKTRFKKMPMKIGKTYIDEEGFKITAIEGRKYEKGFHFFRSLEAAKTHAQYSDFDVVVVMVKTKNLTATGTQRFMSVGKAEVGVAKEITLLKIVYPE